MRVPVVAVAMPLVQLTESRNRRGQGDGRPKSRQILWSTTPTIRLIATTSNRARKTNCPTTKAAGLRRSILAVDGNAIKLHAVVDEAVAEFFRDDFLQRLKLGVDKFDDLAGFDIDQMVMMRFG